MKLVLQLLMALGFTAPAYTKAETKTVDTAVVAVAATEAKHKQKTDEAQEEEATKLFEKAKTLSAFKKACEEAMLFQFAKIADTIKADPKSAFSLEKSGKYKKLAAAIKARFSFANFREALVFVKS